MIDKFSFVTVAFIFTFCGFICGTLVTRNYWHGVFERYTTQVTEQYKRLLTVFGIHKNKAGVWEMRNKEGIWEKK